MWPTCCFFAVREGRQAQGVGSALLAWLEQVALVAGVRRFVVEARTDKRRRASFYLRHGYRELETGRRMYYGVLDGVRLEKVV
jgi:GNAT superfamily N-acetyltransferase